MALDPVTITVDHAQKRMSRDRLSILAQGSYEGTNGRVCGWHPTLFSNVWCDPITFTLMLRPLQLSENWHTLATGSYARLTKSSFTFANSSKWSDSSRDFNGDTWLVADNCSSEWALTTSTWAKNRPWFISWMSFNTGSDYYKEIEFGWNSTASGASGPSMRVYSNGKVEVWEDGALLGSGSIGGNSQASQAPDQNGASTAGQWTTLLVIPFRKREILFYSPTTGGGFTWVFDDIDEDDANPTITPATKFWFMRPSGSANVQCAPITFATSGYACSDLQSFALPPETGRTVDTRLYSDVPYYGTSSVAASLVETDGSTVFVPDDVLIEALIKVSFTSDGTCTPFVYGALAAYGPEFTDTDDSEQADIPLIANDGEAVASDLRLTVTERAGDTRFSFTVRNPDGSGIAGIDTISNRPVLVKIGTQYLMDGRNEPPHKAFGMNAELHTLQFDVRDWWVALERYRFQEPVPLDNVALKDALEWILGTVGVDSSLIDIEDPAYTIPSVSGTQSGEWGTCIKAGDTAAEWIERLFETYAGNWFYDFVPTATGIKFVAKSPASLSETPDLELFDTWQDSYDWFISNSYTADQARNSAPILVINTFRTDALAPECNEVRVTGHDPRLDKPIQAYKRDLDSIDAELLPSMRPANWLGELSRFALGEPSLTTQASVERCVELLFPRLTSSRNMAEWDGKMLFKEDGSPIWKGDCVEYNSVNYRITALTVDFIKEPNSDDFAVRNAHYVAEQIDAVDQPWRGAYSASDLLTIKNLRRIGIEAGGMRRESKTIKGLSPRKVVVVA